MEPDNPHSRFAVAVKNEDDKIVGCVPAEISKIFNKFLSEDGTIEAECIGSRFNKARTLYSLLPPKNECEVNLRSQHSFTTRRLQTIRTRNSFIYHYVHKAMM